MNAFLYFNLALQLSCIFFILRTFEVYAYRRKLLAAIFDHKDWMLYYLMSLDVSFFKMVFQFWRSPASFYPPELTKLVNN